MPQADPDRLVKCVKLGEELPALASAPFPNEIGKYILEHLSKQGWDLWLQESVRIINTYGIELGTKAGNTEMFKQLGIWLGLEEGELAKTAWTPMEDEAEK